MIYLYLQSFTTLKTACHIAQTLCLILIHTLLQAHPQIPFPPIEYIQNQGQWNAPFEYKGTTSKGDVYLRKNGFTLFMSDEKNAKKIESIHHGGSKVKPEILDFYAYKINFINSNANVKITHEKEQQQYYNYMLGNDPSAWKSNIHPALAVNYTALYQGVDMHVYSENANVKYDLIIQPHSNIEQIKLNYEGVQKLSIRNGQLKVQTSLGEVTELAPYTYQYINDKKVEIPCEYVLEGNTVSFKVDKKYNPDYTLFIDPTLVFCSFVGSTADSWGYTATFDTIGNFYAGGIVLSAPYPVSVGAIQSTFGGGVSSPGIVACDACFTKFNATGTGVIFSTYLGGNNNEQPHSMIVDNLGNLIVVGRTFSSNFPITGAGIWDATYNGGGDIFVCKINATGTLLVASTFIGGAGEDGVNIYVEENIIGGLKRNYADDARSEVIVDANNNIYLTGCTKSVDFPTMPLGSTVNSGAQDAVIIQLNPSLGLLWSRYWGGTANDAGYVLAINKSNPNELFVAGGTESAVTMPAGGLNPSYIGGVADGFLLKFNTVTKAMLNATYIGTNAYDQVYGVQTDNSNNVYVTGQTLGAYPVTAGVYSVPNSSQFVTKLNNNLSSIIASTVFGTGTSATTDISINAFLIDKCENIYISGWGGALGGFNVAGSTTTGLPFTPSAIQSTTDGNDFYVIVFNKNFATLQYATFFGGPAQEHVDGGTSRFDQNGVIYQAICGGCGGLTEPTTSGVIYPTNLSPNCNLTALKVKFDFLNPDATASATGNLFGCAPLTINFLNTSTSAVTYIWDFGDGSPTSTATSPTHIYTTAGTFTVTLIANNPAGCTASSDTTTLLVNVKNDTIHADFTFTKIDSCNPYTASFINTSLINSGNPGAAAWTIYTWDFGDGSPLFTGSAPPLHAYPTLSTYTITLTMTDTSACNSPNIIKKVIDFNTSFVKAGFLVPDSICMPANITFINTSTNVATYNWNFGDGNTSALSSPTNTYTAPGTYNITLITTNPASCNKIDSVKKTIHVFPSPTADFTYSPNPPQPNKPFIFTNLSIGASSYLWDFGDGEFSTIKDPTHAYNKEGLYTVCLTAKNDIGCADSVCRQIRGLVIPLVDVPSGFTPNGDGVNDYIYVRGYGIETINFKIYNRWGQKIFETKDIKKGWDGKYKGVLQEMEVYAYSLDVNFVDGTKTFKKGNITLLK